MDRSGNFPPNIRSLPIPTNGKLPTSGKLSAPKNGIQSTPLAETVTAVAETKKPQPHLLVKGFPQSWTDEHIGHHIAQTFVLYGGVNSITIKKANAENGKIENRIVGVELRKPENAVWAAQQLDHRIVGDGNLIEQCTLNCELLAPSSEQPTLRTREAQAQHHSSAQPSIQAQQSGLSLSSTLSGAESIGATTEMPKAHEVTEAAQLGRLISSLDSLVQRLGTGSIQQQENRDMLLVHHLGRSADALQSIDYRMQNIQSGLAKLLTEAPRMSQEEPRSPQFDRNEYPYSPGPRYPPNLQRETSTPRSGLGLKRKSSPYHSSDGKPDPATETELNDSFPLKQDSFGTLGTFATVESNLSKQPSLYQEYPAVDVTLKVWGISKVDVVNRTYEADFIVEIDWIDEQLANINPKQLKTLDWKNTYFNPCVIIENARDNTGDSFLPGASEYPRFWDLDKSGEFKETWLKKTQRFRGKLMCPLQSDSYDSFLTRFPFDVHMLPIVVKLKPPSIKLFNETSPQVKLRNSRRRHTGNDWKSTNDPRLKGNNGHWISPTVPDQLVEFTLLSIEGAPSAKGKGFLPSSPALKRQSSIGDFFQASDPDRSPLTKQGSKQALGPGKKDAMYRVQITIARPPFSSYFWSMVVMNLLVLLSTVSFWDTAAPEISSRMTIALTILLTIATSTSNRPKPIENAMALTYYDRCAMISLAMVSCLSVLNVASVTMCSGEHPEAPAYMFDMHEENGELCNVGWCKSRNIDCHFLSIFLVIFLVVSVANFLTGVVHYRMILHRAGYSATETTTNDSPKSPRSSSTESGWQQKIASSG